MHLINDVLSLPTPVNAMTSRIRSFAEAIAQDFQEVQHSAGVPGDAQHASLLGHPTLSDLGLVTGVMSFVFTFGHCFTGLQATISLKFIGFQ